MVFQAWDCEPFEFSQSESRYFMRVSLEIECASPDHKPVTLAAAPLIAIWPVGAVLLFASLTLTSRKSLLHHTPSSFVRAISFLHAE